MSSVDDDFPLTKDSKDNQKSKEQKEGLENRFALTRDKLYENLLSSEILFHGLQMDSDVYRYNPDGTLNTEPVLRNRERFITNERFKNQFEITQYLRYWGKIPQFLEVRSTPNKGYGIFTVIDIPKLTFLGYYDGMRRPVVPKPYTDTVYGFLTMGFDNKVCAVTDAENITFSNWARYINDGKEPNIEYTNYNMQVHIFTIRDVVAGEELLGSYGDDYWRIHTQRGYARLN